MPNSTQRQIIIAVVCLSASFCFSYFMLPRHGVKAYDCSIAEISPDYPVDVKNACRKLRADQIK